MRRHTYNYIVILDQGTEDIEDDQKLINLRNALLKWDPMHDNSKKLKFLKGGYEDFNHLCPWETTQHYKTNPNEDVDEPLSDVEIEPEPECQELESSKSKTNIQQYYQEEIFIYFFIILIDKQIQYPSLDSVQNNLTNLQIKSIVNNNVTDIKLKLNHKDGYSSEEEISQISTERPMFDRSTKVLRKFSIITENT